MSLARLQCLNLVGNAFDYIATASGFERHSQFLASDKLIQAVKYTQLAVIVAIIALWPSRSPSTFSC